MEVPESTIKMLSMWESSAYIVRTPREKLVPISARLIAPDNQRVPSIPRTVMSYVALYMLAVFPFAILIFMYCGIGKHINYYPQKFPAIRYVDFVDLFPRKAYMTKGNFITESGDSVVLVQSKTQRS